MLQRVEQALEHKNLFERERTSNRTRALGITLHHLGLSLRDVETVLGGFEPRSHEAGSAMARSSGAPVRR